jgi:Holliday junction resolvase-like predicted endonuclease
MSLKKDDVKWTIQKMCVDIGEYELIVEKEKSHWNCEQKRESWKWLISYHGSIVASGSQNSVETAQEFALANMPEEKKTS